MKISITGSKPTSDSSTSTLDQLEPLAPESSINLTPRPTIPKPREAYVPIDDDWLVSSYFLDTLLRSLDESKFASSNVVRINNIYSDPNYWRELSQLERKAVGPCVEFLIKYGWFLNKD